MSNLSYEKQFAQWIELRELFKQAKRNKDYQSVINTGLKIIELGERTPKLGIMFPLFEKDIADAHLKTGNAPLSIFYYQKAIESYKKYRATQKLRNPNDFLSDIEKIQKKLDKLKQA